LVSFVYLCREICKSRQSSYPVNYLRKYGTNFHQISSVSAYRWWWMINLIFILGSLKERCYNNQLSWCVLQKPTLCCRLFFALAFHNELEYCHSDELINSGDDTFTNFECFGPATPVISSLECNFYSLECSTGQVTVKS